ncbi:hypothetical protein KR009_002489 [Drosophila setifemur]|nr:hypothetical protein KR009_002489 [Drosophila setifemur]
MRLISTSKKTVLSDFADLETKSEYVHASGETTDFQFNGQRRVFVEVDKMAGLAVMRIKGKDDRAPEIQRVRKLTIDNAYCVACAKQTPEEIAVGQSGSVKLYNFRTAQLIHRFPADAQRSTVLYMDYNCTDEYIAAVREGGAINVFGTKTKQKLNNFTVDGESTLVRFHPSKRFQLSIASYKGAVTVYDVQSKRKIFHADAHSAPCRDISMCSALPNLLVSVGYDCKINIFDIRRNRVQASSDRLNFSHPLSTVALSECGLYFCAGNLKGELIAYDMRSTKAPLVVKNVHDGAVTRVAFVPVSSEENAQNGSLNSSGNVTGVAIPNTEAPRVERAHSDELRKSIAANNLAANIGFGITPQSSVRPQRDSFCDFLDAQGPRGGVDRMSTRLGTSARDSFDWDALNRKPALLPETAQRGTGLSSADNSYNSSTTDSLQQTLSGPLKDRSNISGDCKLMKITETDEPCEEPSANCSGASTGSDKENPPPVDADLKRRLRLLSASRNSTPHHSNVTPQSSNLELKPQQLLAKSSSGLSAQVDVDLQNELRDLRDHFNEKFSKLHQEMACMCDLNRKLMIEKMAEISKFHINDTQDIRDALDLLLKGDTFVQDYTRLYYENETLKAQVKFYKEREETQSCVE